MQETRFTTHFLETIDDVLRSRDSAKEGVRAAAVVIAMTHGEVNVDDLRDCVEAEGDSRFFGAILASLARGGILEKFGFQKTRRKTSHGRDIGRFRLVGDWERRWPAAELNPKSKIMFNDDGTVAYVEEKRVVA
jgi:hypothetical protein